jgi:geranylgeranyl diphosphate synthase type II
MPSGPAAVLMEAMRYSALAPGKRLRPCLVLACCEAVGGSGETALDAACAVELVHAFSLIHDDLPAIDDDDLRRGRPTCHVQFGEATAILAGDALFALAFEAVARLDAPADRVVRVIRALAESSGRDGLVAGEIVDVLTEGKPYTETDLEFIHARKTGALIAASCEIGGLLGGAPLESCESLKRYGEKVGLAFQVADDLLNEESTSDALGKAAGTDKARGKATYPALYGLEGARAAAARFVEEALRCLPSTLQERQVLDHLARYAVDRSN